MKILIAEDEIAIREGLEHYISNETPHEIVGTAANGSAGLSLIRQTHPDIVITDIRMPVMDGLEMLQRCHDEGLSFNAIILSGYSEFAYAQRAISLGVKEYLLKPLDSYKLFAALERISSSITSDTATEPQLLWNYLSAHGAGKEDIKKRLLIRQPLFSAGSIVLYLLVPVHCTAERIAELAGMIQSAISRCIMDKYVIISLVDTILMVFPGSFQYEHIDRNIRNRIIPFFHEDDCVFVRSTCEKLEGITGSIGMMREISEHVFEHGCTGILSEEVIKEFTPEPLPEYSDLVDKLGSGLLHGSKDMIDEAFQLFRGRVLSRRSKRSEIQQAVIQFSKAVFAGDAAGGEAFVNEITVAKTASDIESAFELLYKHAVSAARLPDPNVNQIISCVLREIQLNYHRQLTLHSLAEIAGVTPEYLSHLFVRETGVNLVSYIKTVRIENAKRILLSGKEKIRDIAVRTGFTDPKYFNRIFKEETGMTPSEYQAVHRLIP